MHQNCQPLPHIFSHYCRLAAFELPFFKYLLCFVCLHAQAAYSLDLDAAVKAATEPVKAMINTYYPVGIFITGALGAVMQQQGDLRDRMLGFGKGALIGGTTVLAVKAGLGV